MHIYHYIVVACCLLFVQIGTASAQHQTAQAPSVPLIEPEELSVLDTTDNIVILDTRSPEEYQEGHLEHACFVNYATFSLQDVADISKDQKVIVYCKKGGRSNEVANKLIRAGYKRVKSLDGGITRWQEEGYQIAYE